MTKAGVSLSLVLARWLVSKWPMLYSIVLLAIGGCRRDEDRANAAANSLSQKSQSLVRGDSGVAFGRPPDLACESIGEASFECPIHLGDLVSHHVRVRVRAGVVQSVVLHEEFGPLQGLCSSHEIAVRVIRGQLGAPLSEEKCDAVLGGGEAIWSNSSVGYRMTVTTSAGMHPTYSLGGQLLGSVLVYASSLD